MGAYMSSRADRKKFFFWKIKNRHGFYVTCHWDAKKHLFDFFPKIVFFRFPVMDNIKTMSVFEFPKFTFSIRPNEQCNHKEWCFMLSHAIVHLSVNIQVTDNWSLFRYPMGTYIEVPSDLNELILPTLNGVRTTFSNTV